MRDDFSNATKELLAKRVGFRCSNPGCRHPTSGPQVDPKESINIGVGAHITAASLDGPRYSDRLTTEERSAADNGIWLCQSCAKLIDNDPLKYTVDVLKDWRQQAESTAARELEFRLRRHPDSAGLFERMERLVPALLSEMRQDLEAHPLRREFVVMKRTNSYWAKGNELYYFYDDHDDLDDKLRLLQNEGLIRDITHTNTKRCVISERLAEYLGAP